MTLVAAFAIASTALLLGALTPDEEAGKRIFREGEGTGEIVARVGRSGAAVPASALPCGSCHGEDGLGRPEGGAAPSDVRWSQLTKRYGHEHPGRRHGAFDERSVARAITAGLDPAGNRLDDAMPRYSMSATDLRLLVAYLRRLEHDGDPGVSATALRFGVVLPAAGALAAPGAAMRTVLEAVFAEANASGGINGRRLVLEVATHDGTAAGAEAAARRLATGGRVFALVAGLFPNAEAQVAAVAEAQRIPLVAPFSLDPPAVDGAATQAFFTWSGARDQGRALVRHAAGGGGGGDGRGGVDAGGGGDDGDGGGLGLGFGLGLAARRLAVIDLEGGAHRASAEAACEEARARGLEVTAQVAGTARLADVARELKTSGADAVLLLAGDDAIARFAAAADALGYAPLLLVPGALASGATVALPAAFSGRVLVAFPAPPVDASASAAPALARIATATRLGDRHRQVQVSAYVAGSLVKEALRRCGRAVSRARLVAALEQLYDFDPGVGVRLTFGPTRRIGSSGAYVVAPDRAARSFRPVGWIALDARR